MRILPKINSFHAVAEGKKKVKEKHEDGLKQMFSFIASLNIL